MTKKIKDIEMKTPGHGKYITTQEFNKLTAENFAEKLEQGKLASKDDIANFKGKLITITKKSYFK